MNTVDIIIQLNEGKTLADVAEEVNAALGLGGDPDAEQVENVLGAVNTPVQGGYCRVRVHAQYLSALQGAAETATSCQIVRVEYPGETYEPITWTENDEVCRVGDIA